MPAPTSDTEFESSLADLKFAELSDKCPLVVDYLIGFQTLDVNDDQTSATGVFGAKVGDSWVYLPTFYRKGELLGGELMYIVDDDAFVPLNDAWVLHVLNRKAYKLGDKSKLKPNEVSRFEGADLFRMRRSPMYGKYASAVEGAEGRSDVLTAALGQGTPPDYFARCRGKVAACWFSNNVQPWTGACAAMVVSPNDERYAEYAKRAHLVDILQRSGPKIASAALTTLRRLPKMAKALEIHYSADTLAAIPQVLSKAAESAPEGINASLKRHDVARVQILRASTIKDLPDALDMTAQEKRMLLQGKVVVKDQRGNTSFVCPRSPNMHLSGTQKPGIAKVLEAKTGQPVTMVLLKKLDPRDALEAARSPVKAVSEMADMRSTKTTPLFLVPVDQKEYPGYLESDQKLAVVENSDDWFTFGDRNKTFIAGDSIQKGKVYVPVFDDDKSSVGGVYVDDVKEEGGVLFVTAYKLWQWDNYSINPKSLSTSDKIVIVLGTQSSPKVRTVQHDYDSGAIVSTSRYGCRFIEIQPSRTRDVGTEKPVAQGAPAEQPRKEYKTQCVPLPPQDLDLLIRNNSGGEVLRVQYSAGHYSFLTGDGYKTVSEKQAADLNEIEALTWLTKEAGIHGDTAVQMLDDARHSAARATYWLKRAELYKQAGPENLLSEGGIGPALDNTMYGGQHTTDSATRRPMISGIQTNLVQRNQNMSMQGRPDQAYNMHPDALAPTPLDLSDAAAKTDQKEMFDVAALDALVREGNMDTKLDEIVGDLLIGLDRLGRTYFLYLQHTPDFAEIYGENDMKDLKEQLVGTFEQMGDTVMFLKRKWSKGQRSEGSGSTDIG